MHSIHFKRIHEVEHLTLVAPRPFVDWPKFEWRISLLEAMTRSLSPKIFHFSDGHSIKRLSQKFDNYELTVNKNVRQ